MTIQTNSRDQKLSAETRALIDQAVNAGKITKIQPASGRGNEACRATNELVARRRREFRKANKKKEA